MLLQLRRASFSTAFAPGREIIKGQPVAGVERRTLGAGEEHSVVAHDNDHGVVGTPGFFQDLDRPAIAGVEPGDGLVILRQLGAHIRMVGEEIGNRNLVGMVPDLIIIRILSVISKVAVGIGKSHMKIKGTVADTAKELHRPVGHPLRAPGRSFDLLVVVGPGINLERLDVELADDPGRVSGFIQDPRNGKHVGAGVEIVNGVAVSVLSVRMAVVPGQDVRPAGGTGGGGAKGIGEKRPPRGEGVNVGSPDHRTAVAARNGTPVIGDQQQDVTQPGQISSSHREMRRNSRKKSNFYVDNSGTWSSS